MRILITHFGLYKKNGWGRTFELAKGLSQQNNSVIVLCSAKGRYRIFDVITEQNVKIVRFYDVIPKKILSSGMGVFSLINRVLYAATHKFDIVHSDSHRESAFYPCIVNKTIYKSKFVIEWWDNFAAKLSAVKCDKWYKKVLAKRELRTEISTKQKADGCTVMSKLLFNKALSVGIPSNKLMILHGGCDVKNIQYLPDSTAGKKLLGTDAITFGFIGMGDVEYDDLKVFFEAFSELYKDHNIKFLNYGRPFVKSIAKLPQMKDFIIECGWIDYYKDATVLSATDVFVLTKQDDVINNSGWPTKYGDYLSCGRAVLLNTYGELIEFNRTYKAGVIEVLFDKENIKSEIIKVCSGKYDLKKMNDTNRAIAENHSWFHKSEELNGFYKRLLTNE